MGDSLRSLIGICCLLLIAYVFSNNRKNIKLRTVGAAFLMQVLLGAFMLYVPAGKWVVNIAATGVDKILEYSHAGSEFLFSGLVTPKMFEVFGDGGFVFAFQVLPSIIFMTSLLAILYYLGIMKGVITALGFVFEKIMRVSKVESFAAVTTVFLGQSELPAALKPFIGKMNRNELFTVICSGMAAVSGSVLIGYAGLGVPIVYLLAASLMAIPGGILFARILSPATEESTVEFDNISFGDKRPVSIIEAAANGAMVGLKIAAGVATVVMAFVALIAMLNGIIGGIGGLFNIDDLTLQSIFGFVLSPLTYLMGVSWENSDLVGSFIGQKIAINEFVAYLDFAPYVNGTADIVLDQKTIAIASFALCGFANFSSIGVVIGAFSAVAPERSSDIAQLGVRALLAATLSNLMSATIAGLFIGISAVHLG